MKNIRVEGQDICYDCDGRGCPTPGVPHRISLDMFFASLEAAYREYLMQEDPRAEALDVVMQLAYETIYGKQDTACPIGPEAPWHATLTKLVLMLDTHYADLEVRPSKEFLN